MHRNIFLTFLFIQIISNIFFSFFRYILQGDAIMELYIVIGKNGKENNYIKFNVCATRSVPLQSMASSWQVMAPQGTDWQVHFQYILRKQRCFKSGHFWRLNQRWWFSFFSFIRVTHAFGRQCLIKRFLESYYYNEFWLTCKENSLHFNLCYINFSWRTEI